MCAMTSECLGDKFSSGWGIHLGARAAGGTG